MLLRCLGALPEAFSPRWRLPVIYTVAGVAGSLASLFLLGKTSIGASGAIIGLAGYLAAMSYLSPGALPKSVRVSVLTTIGLAAYLGAFGFFFIDNAASVAFSVDSETMCEKPKLTLVSFAVKLHSPCPPDMTRHGAPSGSPLFNSATSINGHFVAAGAALAAASRYSPNRNNSLMWSPPLVELHSPGHEGTPKTSPNAFLEARLMRGCPFGFNVTRADPESDPTTVRCFRQRHATNPRMP
jgi:membrane associated rhomboid family serine protease